MSWLTMPGWLRDRAGIPRRSRAGHGRWRSFGGAHVLEVGIEASEPADYFVSCHGGVTHLTVLLGALACCKDPRGDRTCADELTHRSIHPFHVEQVVLLPFGEQNVLFHVVQNPFKRVLCDGGEEIIGRLGASDVHALRDAPVEHRAWQR